MPPLLLAILACGPGPIDLSTVTDTRIISIAGDPPEPWPGENTTITTTVVNPQDRDLEVLTWTCVPYEDQCVEEVAIDKLVFQASIFPVVDGQASSVRRVPDVSSAELQVILDSLGDLDVEEDDYDYIPIPVWSLACPVNECDIINRVREVLRRDGPTGGSLGDDLYDPTRWMTDLPVDGVSLSTKFLRIARPDRVDRNDNPQFEPRWLAADDDVLVMEPNTAYEMAFKVEDPDRDKVWAYGYTTYGRFEDRREKIEDETVRMYLLTPSSSGRGDVWIVFEDDEGGAAVWHKPFRVR